MSYPVETKYTGRNFSGPDTLGIMHNKTSLPASKQEILSSPSYETQDFKNFELHKQCKNMDFKLTEEDSENYGLKKELEEVVNNDKEYIDDYNIKVIVEPKKKQKDETTENECELYLEFECKKDTTNGGYKETTTELENRIKKDNIEEKIKEFANDLAKSQASNIHTNDGPIPEKERIVVEEKIKKRQEEKIKKNCKNCYGHIERT